MPGAERQPPQNTPQDNFPATSYHVQRALVGDAASLEWLVAHLSPLLRAQAAYRLGPELRAFYEPDDLVQEAWLVLLPKIATLQPRGGRHTPVLLKFLSTTLLHRIRNLARKHITGTGAPAAADAVDAVAADVSGAVSHALRAERRAEVSRCLAALPEHDREVLILRAIEQHTIKTSAVLLGVGEEAVAKRYTRALARLRQALPRSVFDELED
jgi:RNA polymerase sigma-70 factor (ECF subfamily)